VNNAGGARRSSPRLKLQRATITRYEQGTLNIKADRLYDIATALEVDLGIFYALREQDSRLAHIQKFATASHDDHTPHTTGDGPR